MSGEGGIVICVGCTTLDGGNGPLVGVVAGIGVICICVGMVSSVGGAVGLTGAGVGETGAGVGETG